MIIYTVKDQDGTLRPQVFLSEKTMRKTIVNNELVELDFGLTSAFEFLESRNGKGFTLATCELIDKISIN